jgi:PAS domain S-box-containing protein
MNEVSGDLALRELMHMAAFGDFETGGLLVLNLDKALTVESSAWVSTTGEEGRRRWPEGRGVFDAADLKGALAEHLAGIRRGQVRSFDIAADEPGRGRIHVTVLPRFGCDGRRIGYFLVAQDMSAKDADGLAARIAEERLHIVLRRAADAIITIGETGIIEDANLAAERLFDWPEGALVGRPVADLMPAAYAGLHQAWIESYMRTGQSGILNVGPRPLPAVTRSGAPISVELSISEAWIGGKRKFVGVCRDIGERLEKDRQLREANAALAARVDELTEARAELERQSRRVGELARAAELARTAAEEADAAKSQLLVTVSHELRTPLNGVLAVVDLLARRPLDPESHELIDIVRRSGHDLVELVTDLLDLSRMEAGALALHAAPFDLGELVSDIAGVWRVAAQAKGLGFRLNRPRELPRLVGDGARLRQVLANLVSNAIKYTETGRITVGVGCRPAGEGAVRLRLCVADTGGGLDAEARARLFQPFARGGGAATRREPGAGVGLAICRQLVTLMGGRIEAEDVPGGARFTVTLELPQAAPAAEEPRRAQAAPEIGRRLRALVAEDHPVNRTIMQLLLDQLGVDYLMVEDGLEAVEAVAAGQFDLILMDMRMPRMDGLEASRRIRQAGVAAPIVAVTADALGEGDPEIFRAGVDAVLAKPITLASLAEAISSVLDGVPRPLATSSGG